jgi:CRP-like cAMP-binding protein
VTVDGEPVSTIGPGGFFGEIAILDHGPRIATVTADTDMELLIATSRELNAIIRDVPLVSHRMLSETCARLRGAHDNGHAATKRAAARTAVAEHEAMRAALAVNPN